MPANRRYVNYEGEAGAAGPLLPAPGAQSEPAAASTSSRRNVGNASEAVVS